MSYITSHEMIFLFKLKKDLNERKEKSFFTLLFLGNDLKELNNSELKDKVYQLIINNTKHNYPIHHQVLTHAQWISEIIGQCFLGKYKEHFIVVDKENHIYSVGKEIQNIPLYMLPSSIRNPSSIEVKAQIKKEESLDYNMLLLEYKKFCKEMSMVFSNDIAHIKKQSEEFDKWLAQEPNQ